MQPAQGRHAAACVQLGSDHPHLSVIEFKPCEDEMNVYQNYRKWRRYRDTLNELNRLSNRELNDLGIARGNIEQIARSA